MRLSTWTLAVSSPPYASSLNHHFRRGSHGERACTIRHDDGEPPVPMSLSRQMLDWYSSSVRKDLLVLEAVEEVVVPGDESALTTQTVSVLVLGLVPCASGCERCDGVGGLLGLEQFALLVQRQESLDFLLLHGLAAFATQEGLHVCIHHAGTQCKCSHVVLFVGEGSGNRIHGRLGGVVRSPAGDVARGSAGRDEDDAGAARLAQFGQRGTERGDECDCVDVEDVREALWLERVDSLRRHDACVEHHGIERTKLVHCRAHGFSVDALIGHVALDTDEVRGVRRLERLELGGERARDGHDATGGDGCMARAGAGQEQLQDSQSQPARCARQENHRFVAHGLMYDVQQDSRMWW
ncbi:hypothetical protein L1887_48185 [Cichorium endivia]|nr:hypothetical protein L1887_48185 [Cichorium endivia]